MNELIDMFIFMFVCLNLDELEFYLYHETNIAHYIDFDTWSYVIFDSLIYIVKKMRLLDVYSYYF